MFLEEHKIPFLCKNKGQKGVLEKIWKKEIKRRAKRGYWRRKRQEEVKRDEKGL